MSDIYKETPAQAAKLIQAVIKQNLEQGIKALNELLDVILDPTKLDSWINVVGWLRELVTDGSDWSSFAKLIRDKDDSPYCGCVWTSDFVAYRCRTCATSPCMSLCAACFERGNHEGHDYNMFRSEAGGACDCGDPHVMSTSGFCPHHGPDRIKPQKLPTDFIMSTKVVIERMIIAVFHVLRHMSKHSASYEKAWNDLSSEIKEMLNFLHELVKLGSPIINIVSEFLLNEKVYSNIKSCQGFTFLLDTSSPQYSFHEKSNEWFQKSLMTIKDPVIPPGIDDSIELGESRNYTKLIDELTFWIVRYDFVEPLILFVLNLLPNGEMKKGFAKAFIKHYARVACTLNDSNNSDPLTNRLSERVVHVSVQLFSNEEIAYALAEQEHLIEIFLISLYNVLHIYLDDSTTGHGDRHKYVSMTSGPRGRTHAYWPIASDFSNFLGHASVATFFLSHDELLVPWVRMMIPFCGMELNHRAMDRHIEFEPNHMLNHYYMIRETCASPLLCILDVLKDKSTLSYAIKLVRHFIDAIRDFFKALGFGGSELPHDQVSFHYPLHRYVSSIIANAIRRQGARLDDFGIGLGDAKRLVAHPLHILTVASEINNNMWVRNGLYIQTQALAYKQHLFSRFHIDADIFLIQVLSSVIPADYFVANLINRFRVFVVLSLNGITFADVCKSLGRGFPDADRQPMMLEASLRLILNLLSNRNCMDLSEEEQMRNEVVSLIACRPRTFSALNDNISHCNDANQGVNKNLGDILRKVVSDVAIKKEARDAMEQTTYVLKPESWQLYDPIFLEQRVLYKRDCQEAFKHYYNSLITAKQITPTSLNLVHAWPPYRKITPVASKYGDLLKILTCDNMHSIIYLILHKFSIQYQLVTETSLSLALHLLKSALQLSESLDGAEGGSSEVGGVIAGQMRLFNFWRSPNIWDKLEEKVPQQHAKMSTTATAATSTSATDPTSSPSTSTQILSYALVNDAFVGEESPPTSPGNTDPQQESSSSSSIQIRKSESIVSLLISIYNHHTSSYFELPHDVYTCDELTPPCMRNTIRNLLVYIAAHSPHHYNVVKQAAAAANPRASATEADASGNKEETDDLEARRMRRMRARKARDAMMHKLQQDQKKFMKRTLEMEDEKSNEMELSSDSGTAATAAPAPTYECVICREARPRKHRGGSQQQQQAPTAERGRGLLNETMMDLDHEDEGDEAMEITTTTAATTTAPRQNEEYGEDGGSGDNFDFGLICYVHESTSLGRRRVRDTRLGYGAVATDDDDDDDAEVMCAPKNMRTRDLLANSKFATAVQEMSLMAQTRGIHISTCGHYVHQQCHTDYMRSIEMNDRHQFHESRQHGTACPVCRQPSNFILPIDLDRAREDDWGVEPEVIVSKLYAVLYDHTPRFPDNMENYFHSVLRFNVEQSVMQASDHHQHDHTTTTTTTPRHMPLPHLLFHKPPSSGQLYDKRLVNRKIPIKAIFYMYYAVGQHERDSDHSLHVDTSVMRMKRRLSFNKSDIGSEANKLNTDHDLPLLLLDPFTLLMQLMPDCACTLRNYRTMLKLVFPLAFITSLLLVLRRFSAEERGAWRNASRGDTSALGTLKQLVSMLLSSLPDNFFLEDPMSQCGSDEICFSRAGSVFTPQSLISMVEDELMVFLKLSALLQHRVFTASSSEDDQVSSPPPHAFQSSALSYAEYLDLFGSSDASGNKCSVTSSVSSSSSSGSGGYLHQCLDLAKMEHLIRRWCSETSDLVRGDMGLVRHLLTPQPMWKLPKLIAMPHKYSQFFQHYRGKKCIYCGKSPSQPAVCLVCGSLVCYKSDCCRTLKSSSSSSADPDVRVSTTTRHARECGEGSSIFVLVNSALVFIMRPKRACLWGTLYLDDNGEEDYGWKRGKPIFLKEERLHLLEKQWRRNLFDHVCKGWSVHNNSF